MDRSAPGFFVSRLVTLALLAAPVVGQWLQVATTGPSPRYATAMAYDGQRSRTVLFGGGGLGDTWEWDGASWALVATTGPIERQFHALAYDEQRGVVVLFGGLNTATSTLVLGDTWEWDGAIWTPHLFVTGPSARLLTAMAYDRQRAVAVLFGGEDAGGVALGDTWEWNGVAWTQRVVNGPPPRRDHAMAYDGQRGRTVLFGGRDPFDRADTWEWDGNIWQQVATTGPAARSSFAMAHDRQRGLTVLFGGTSGGTTYGDTWEWDGSTWSQVVGPAPSQRFGHAMAFDTLRAATVLFGGVYTGILGDTWELNPAAALAMGTPYGTGCGVPALQLDQDPAQRPIVGTIARARIGNVPAASAYAALGLSNLTIGAFPLPLDLSSYGLTGCLLWADAMFGAHWPTVPTGPGSAAFDFTIPNSSVLVGVTLFVQAWSPAPGVNPAGVVVSNGLEWQIGQQ